MLKALPVKGYLWLLELNARKLDIVFRNRIEDDKDLEYIPLIWCGI